MNKENLKKNFGVNAEKIKWQEFENGGYKWQASAINRNGYYINKENGDYTVVDSKTNSVCGFTHDLSDLEE